MSQLQGQGLSVCNPGVSVQGAEGRLGGTADPQASSPEPDLSLLALWGGPLPPQPQVGYSSYCS